MQHLADDWRDGYERAKAAAEERALGHWIYAGLLYVQDGGKRGRWGLDGMTVDGVEWQVGFGSTSARKASEEEQSMWTALTGLE